MTWFQHSCMLMYLNNNFQKYMQNRDGPHIIPISRVNCIQLQEYTLLEKILYSYLSFYGVFLRCLISTLCSDDPPQSPIFY